MDVNRNGPLDVGTSLFVQAWNEHPIPGMSECNKSVLCLFVC